MAKPKNPTARAMIDRRNELGWTQPRLHEELVKVTGNELWTTKRVQRIENAEIKVTVEMLVDLALALQVDDVDYLVYGPTRGYTQRDAAASATGEESVIRRYLADQPVAA